MATEASARATAQIGHLTSIACGRLGSKAHAVCCTFLNFPAANGHTHSLASQVAAMHHCEPAPSIKCAMWATGADRRARIVLEPSVSWVATTAPVIHAVQRQPSQETILQCPVLIKLHTDQMHLELQTTTVVHRVTIAATRQQQRSRRCHDAAEGWPKVLCGS